MYADDILLYKPTSQPEDYSGLQTDIDAIQDWISTNYLTMNPHKCKYLICSRKIHPHLPLSGDLLGAVTLEQVENYRYLGVLVSSRLTWSDHIEHVCAKARKLVGILYRQFYSWADSNTLLLIYQTCIRPHLEYVCQLWDPFLNKGMQSLEAVQKFACKVCLKQRDLNYDSMFQLLNLPHLSVRRKYLKLTTMYNIVNGHMDFPSSIFVQSNLPYYLNRAITQPSPVCQFVVSILS